jgi:hypothetical protein
MKSQTAKTGIRMNLRSVSKVCSAAICTRGQVSARHPLFVCQRRELQELLDSGLDGWNHYAHMFQFLNISRAHGPWLSPSAALVPFWMVASRQ